MRDKNGPDDGLKTPKKEFSGTIIEKVDRIAESFQDCPDFFMKKVVLTKGKIACFLFLETLVNPESVQQHFIQPLLAMDPAGASAEKLIQNLPVGNLFILPDVDSVITAISSGSVILMLEGEDSVLSGCLKSPLRKTAEPETEKSIHGPHEGFSEDIHTNITLLRNKLLSNHLKFKILNIGELTPKKIAIAYIEGLSQPQLLQRLTNRIEALKFDGIMGTGQVETLIKDFPWSPFPQLQATERPDKAVTALLAGKFLIMLDGTPVTLNAPTSFFAFFQNPDDLNINWLFGTFIHFIRLLAIGLAIFLPALYTALMSFHYYIIPLNFLVPLAETRVQVPFPPFLVVLIIETIIEMVRELASRLSPHIGATIGITGGVLFGLAAVTSGVVSSFVIIVSMMTLIASLILPTYDLGLSTRILKYIAILFAAVFGILGVIVFASVIFAHLITLESLGQPYFQPVIPFKSADLKDIFIRLPITNLRRRLLQAQAANEKRRRNNGESE